LYWFPLGFEEHQIFDLDLLTGVHVRASMRDIMPVTNTSSPGTRPAVV
jgi:hypothetical protein